MNKYVYRPDTGAWVLQVWASFFIALLAAVLGIFYLPVEPWVKGYAAMGLFFTLGSTFTLAKTIRDNRDGQVDTSAWIFVSWVSFVVAILLMGTGIVYLPADLWIKGYMAVGVLFALTATFTLAKTVRDNDEVRRQAASGGVGVDGAVQTSLEENAGAV